MKKLGLKAHFFWLFVLSLVSFFLSQGPELKTTNEVQRFISTSEAFSGKNKPSPKPKKIKKKKKSKKKKVKTKKDPFYNSAALNKIYERQAKRQKRIFHLKKKGIVGESDNGLLKIRKASLLKGSKKNEMEKLVKAENKDRKKVLQALEKQAPYSKQEKILLRRRYFEGNREGDPKGTYFFQADHWHLN